VFNETLTDFIILAVSSDSTGFLTNPIVQLDVGVFAIMDMLVISAASVFAEPIYF